jgi:hypothetical protein
MISTRQAAAIIVVAAFGVLGMSSAGLATAKDGPPGQGPCNHGNSGKECKPDPQPDHGKECDEHGPNEGGVNEDHCAVDTTETTETTVDTTTGTTTSVPPTVETTTTPDPSGCPDGSPGTAGKDGEPGNDNCAAITTGVATTGTPTTTSDVETAPSAPSALTPPVGQRETASTPAARHGVLGAIFVAARARHDSAAKAKGVHVLPFTP